MPLTDPSKAPVARALRGILTVALYVVLAVVLRGVRWDETYEHAQIIAGQVRYPPGHPLALYVHNAFSFQTFLSGLVLKLGGGAGVLCGMRNILFLAGSIAPVYLLAAGLSRSVLAGLMAAALALQGIMLEFDGSYPTAVWPVLYSNGHIGGAAALLGLCALVFGWWRTAFFLVGVLPCIHVGQWPPLAGVTLVYGLHAAWRARRGEADQLMGAGAAPYLGYTLLGLACTVLFWAVHRQGVLPLPESGPFAARAGAEAVWRGYTALHDPHRAFPPGNGHVVLLGAILLCGMGAFSGPSGRFRRACGWLAVFCGGIGAAVWGTMAVHAWLGPEIPFLLIAWMPYRLINLIPPVLLAVVAGTLVVRWPARGRWFLAAALLVGLLQPVWPYIVGAGLHQRYLAGGEGVACGVYGLALAALAPRSGRARVIAAALLLLLLAPLAMFHQFAAACVTAGLAVAYAAGRLGPAAGAFRRPAAWAAGVVTLLAAVGLLWHQIQYREQLPRSSFQAAARAALEDAEGVLLLGPPDSILLQAAVGQAVLAEVATPSLISYVPAIGPAIDQLYRDVYGYGFTFPAPGQASPRPWTELWRARSAEEWRAIAETYGITHVIAPVGMELPLRRHVAGEDYSLYALGGTGLAFTAPRAPH